MLLIVYSVSSPYLLVFGDDHVIRYTRTNDVVGGAGEALSERATMGVLFYGLYLRFL